MPDQLRLRLAAPEDYGKLPALHVQTFRETHGMPGAPTLATRSHQWKAILAEAGPQEFCLLMETRGGEAIGFTRARPYHHEEHGQYEGELNKIYLLKAFHGRGLGRMLLSQTAHTFLQRGIHSMLLFGDARNPSNGFYEKMGAVRLLAPGGAFHGGYGWMDITALAKSCETAANK